MRNLLTLALVATLAMSSFADEKAKGKKKGQQGGKTNPLVNNLMTGLKQANLSEEQSAKVKVAAATFETKLKELREQGLTPELNKKRAEAAKAAREAGLKGKDVMAKVNESLTEQEKALLEKMQAAQVQMKKAVVAVLTKEQMEGLPENVKKQLTVRGPGQKAEKTKGQGKGKKKEAAAASA